MNIKTKASPYIMSNGDLHSFKIELEIREVDALGTTHGQITDYVVSLELKLTHNELFDVKNRIYEICWMMNYAANADNNIITVLGTYKNYIIDNFNALENEFNNK